MSGGITLKDVADCIETIINTMNNKLFSVKDFVCNEIIASNGMNYVVINEDSWNGNYYSDCHYCADNGEPFDKRISVSEVLLQTTDDEFVFVGYVKNKRRAIIYKMVEQALIKRERNDISDLL